MLYKAAAIRHNWLGSEHYLLAVLSGQGPRPR
jgi:hypothetical protein